MSEHQPLCSQTVVFLDGNVDYLKELESRFLKALSDQVHFFSSNLERSRFLIIADGPPGGKQRLIRDVIRDFYDDGTITQRNLDKIRKTGKSSMPPKPTEKRQSRMMSEDVQHISFISGHKLDLVKDRFTWKVYSRDDRTPEEIEKILFDFVTSDPNRSSGGSQFLFNLIGAKKHEVFFVCKLSAIRPIYSLCEYEGSERNETTCLLEPFPSYVNLNERQFKMLNALYSTFKRSSPDDPNADPGFLSAPETAKRSGYSNSNPTEPLRYLVSSGLVEMKRTDAGTNQSHNQYRISDDGIFMLYRVANVKGWSVDLSW